ncbi:MAG: hypothetical protein J7L21_00380 [Sulfurimonas sp.]|nr:hypothetical protein [Sulfurimonas sp.]
MNTSYSLDAYRAHDLNIMMKTSSGDVINMDFSNEQSLSMSGQKDENRSSGSLSFSSMQSFQFSMTSNGIDAQDKKEIKEFMKIAQPFIDNFMKELDDSTQKSPLNQIAHKVAEIFQPMKERNEDTQNLTKNSIVQMFDNSIKEIKNIDKIFSDAQKLLERTLHEFDKIHQELYA